MWDSEGDARTASRAVQAMSIFPDRKESAMSTDSPSWAPPQRLDEPPSVQAGVPASVPERNGVAPVVPLRPDVVGDEVVGVAAGTGVPVPGSREEQLGQLAEPGSFEALQRMFGPPIPPPE